MLSENIIKFEQMKRYFFDQDTVKKFMHYLMTKGSVIAPHRKGECSYTFERVIDVSDIQMVYPRTIQPLKKFFLPPIWKKLTAYLGRLREFINPFLTILFIYFQ